MPEARIKPNEPLDEFDMNQIKLRWLVLRILWAPLFLPLVAYVIIAIISGSEAAQGDATHLTTYVLCFMSAIVLGLAYVVRKASINPTSKINRFMGSYLNSIMVTGALCEAVGICGLVDFFLEGSYLWLSVFVSISAAALVILRPRKQDLIALGIRPKERA